MHLFIALRIAIEPCCPRLRRVIEAIQVDSKSQHKEGDKTSTVEGCLLIYIDSIEFLIRKEDVLSI